MATERCPQCGSANITGRAFDLDDGDEVQERFCYDCQHFEGRLRSRGGVGWYVDDVALHRGFTATGIERTLRDEVYAAPDDDGPRSIYGDWLIERGDPIGTLIALQLGRVQRRDPCVTEEEQAILDAQWRGWLGEAASAIGAQGVACERGFWSAAHLERPIPPRLARDPAWATVRRLAIGEHAASLWSALVTGPLRRSLRRVELQHRGLLDGLAEAPPGLEHVELAFDVSREPPPLVGIPRGVRSVGVHCIGELGAGWVERTAATHVRELVLVTSPQTDDLRSILRAARASVLQRVTIDVRGRHAFLAERDSDGSFDVRRVEIHSGEALSETFANLARSLHAIERHVDPGVKLAMASITPEHARLADAHGMKLVQAATRFAARPTATGRPARS